ncbi:MAG TPA: ABC transporter substrate-binding protein, partial [Methanomassiliicoccales archaeon]|nr:ABC transporter substrate-binding protein [Methanomassiliicoccales archaeon]
IVIKDDRGSNVTLTKYPQRIVTLGSCFTEILFLINASGQVVGVDDLSDFPAGAASKSNVGSYVDLDLNKILALSPDLVITWAHATATIDSLESNDLAVLAFEPDAIGDIMYLIQTLGRATGKEDRAEQVLIGMEAMVEDVLTKVGEFDDADKPTVYVELTKGDGASPGAGTLIDDMIFLAGGMNINTYHGYSLIESAIVVASDPDFIILEVQNNNTDSDIEDRPGWNSISAVEEGNIERIDGALLAPGPRAIYALVQLATWFYPDLFD